MMDTALVIILLCDGDNQHIREMPVVCDWTVDDIERVYESSGWKAENELK